MSIVGEEILGLGSWSLVVAFSQTVDVREDQMPKTQEQFLLSNRHVLYETPISAAADLDVADTFVGDYQIRGVPERVQREFAAHDLLGAAVECFRRLAVGRVDGVLEDLVQLRV